MPNALRTPDVTAASPDGSSRSSIGPGQIEGGEAARFDVVRAEGNALLRSHDGDIFHERPFLVACTCTGGALDLAIRRVTLFALVLSAILTTIVALRAAPFPIVTISSFWFVAAMTARIFRRARAREHGRFLVDFEREVVVDIERATATPLAKTSTLHLVSDSPGNEIVWVFLEQPDLPKTPRLRIGRGQRSEADAVARVFRTYGLRVIAPPIEPDEES